MAIIKFAKFAYNSYKQFLIFLDPLKDPKICGRPQCDGKTPQKKKKNN